MIKLLAWIHVASMVGAFGALLGCQAACPAEARRSEAFARGLSRIVNILIGVGFLAGAALFGVKKGHLMGAHYTGIVGIKFGLLLAVGALVGMSRKPERGDPLRSAACGLLGLASLLGAVALP